MKRLFFALFLAIFGIAGFAQENSNKANDEHVVYIDVPKNMKIKDKIFLKNSSPYTIIQSVVVLVDNMKTIGSAVYVNPGMTITMADYDNNWLKYVRGRRIGIKIKGVKKVLGDTNTTSIGGGGNVGLAFGGFAAGVKRSEMKAEELNNIAPEDITYDFMPVISEANHDLYITVTAGTNSKGGAFDF